MKKINSSLLRQLLFSSKKNNFDKCKEKLGAKIVINEAKVNQWIKESNGKPK